MFIKTRSILVHLILLLSTVHVQAITLKEVLQTEILDGHYGRVMRGNTLEYFDHLNFDPTRKLAFLIGDDSFEKFKEMDGYQMLASIGYPEAYIDHIIEQQFYIKLVIFPREVKAMSATWKNVLDLVIEAYPEFGENIHQHEHALTTLAFEDFEAAAQYKFMDVERIGLHDERYMTYERYFNSSRNLLETRAFLYFTIRLNDLYSGDGYIYDSDGNRCSKEFIILNKYLIEARDYILADIEFEILAFTRV